MSDDPTLYAQLADIKARVDRTDTLWDPLLTDALVTASRQVDEDCGRRFYLDATATARLFRPVQRVSWQSDGEAIIVDDIGDEDALIVEVGAIGGTYATLTPGIDYTTEPDNAIARGRAITVLRRPNSTWMWGPDPRYRVRVTARWGWPAVPAQIKTATLIKAQRLFLRKDSPEGVADVNNFGPIRVGRFDPDYDALIAPYVLPGFG